MKSLGIVYSALGITSLDNELAVFEQAEAIRPGTTPLCTGTTYLRYILVRPAPDQQHRD